MSYDPRRGLPSASAMYRVANCPGSQTLINSVRSVGKYYELPTREMVSGTRIHGYLALDALGDRPQAQDFLSAMNSDERFVSRKAGEIRDAFVSEILGNGQEKELIIEKRFWYRQGLNGPRFSGQPDFIAIKGKRALVINYKTGRIQAEPVADNLQLRTEIVLLKHNRPELEEIYGTIDEPFVCWEPELVNYDEQSFAKAEAQILAFVDRAAWERDKRIAGPWCAKCAARAYCAEAMAYIETIPNPDIGTIIKELPRGQAGVVLWEKIKLAKKLLETLEQTYERILADEPDALPGYILPKKGRGRRIVPDPAAFKQSLAAYLSGEELDQCATYHVAKVEELLALKDKLKPGAAHKLIAQLTKDTVLVIHDAPFIRPITKREREALLNG
jgi:Protein of unknown function (DUF2800)